MDPIGASNHCRSVFWDNRNPNLRLVWEIEHGQKCAESCGDLADCFDGGNLFFVDFDSEKDGKNALLVAWLDCGFSEWRRDFFDERQGVNYNLSCS